MKTRLSLLTLASVLTGQFCLAQPSQPTAASAPAATTPPATAATKHWTADNGNGTYSNPLFYEEFEDPDPIRVGDTYYIAGTTMHMNPAVQLMQSKDLVNWELAGYCMDRLDLGPAFRLEGGNIYGQGIWAPCLRYHKGTFYVFCNINGAGLQVFRSKSIKGPWERNQLPGRHDLSVLFDDDLGKIFVIHGNNVPYPIEELAPDIKSFVANAPKRSLPERMGEGRHLYKINGKYVDVSAIPGGPVDQMVAVADSIDGPWRVTRMVQGESLGVTQATPARAAANDRGLWIHQGGIVDTPSGEWWSIIMSDRGSAGRMVNLVPITWDDGFPLIGLPRNLRKAPSTWIKPDTDYTQQPKPAFTHDDNFDGGKLHPEWQWNHVPDDTEWSVTEKPGVLRLHSLPATNFYNARNSLCQRPPGPESIMTAELDSSGMVAGDTAGLGLVSTPYAWIGVVKSEEGSQLQMTTGSAPRRGRRGSAASTEAEAPTISPVAPPARLWLRMHCNFDTDVAIFSWSADGKQFTLLGNPFRTTFRLTTFQGVRPALFNYNTSGQPGGKHASSMLLLKRLISEGAPIHGVGIQGHWHLNTNLEDVEKAIENYASLELRVAITELDVTAFGDNSGAFPTGENAETMSADAFQKQAEVYAKLFEIFKKHEKSIDRVTFWGISDRRSWRSRQRPLLFDAQLEPKPALQAILDVGRRKDATAQP